MSSVLKTVPYLHAGGSPFSMGHAHGTLMAAPLREFLDDQLCRLNLVLDARVSLDSLRNRLAAYGSEIRSATPRLFEEIRGLALGAGITVDEALLLQVRREVLGYQRIPTLGDCTTYARLGENHSTDTVLAQTIDLNGNLDDFVSVLRLAGSRPGGETLVLSFGGQLGYLGLNSDGLAVGINLVLGGRWRAGLPPYLVIRHLLDTARNVDEALDILGGLTIASSRTITLCDLNTTACVEILGDRQHVVKGRSSIHTNHFLFQDFATQDELNVFGRNSSIQRLEACRAGLAGLAESAVAEEHLNMLARPPICVRDDGNIRRERTVGAVVMFPARGELHLRPGDPSLSRTQVFTLH